MKHLFFLMVLIVSLSFAAFGQGTNQASIEFNVTLTDAAEILTVATEGAAYAGLVPGQCYQVIADAGQDQNILPVLGDETFTPAMISVSGAPGREFVLTFFLPYVVSVPALGSVTFSYDNYSAAWATDGAPTKFFNPTGSYPVMLDIDGAATVNLGGSICVSQDAAADEYIGYAIVVADYVGM